MCCVCQGERRWIKPDQEDETKTLSDPTQLFGAGVTTLPRESCDAPYELTPGNNSSLSIVCHYWSPDMGNKAKALSLLSLCLPNGHYQRPYFFCPPLLIRNIMRNNFQARSDMIPACKASKKQTKKTVGMSGVSNNESVIPNQLTVQIGWGQILLNPSDMDKYIDFYVITWNWRFSSDIIEIAICTFITMLTSSGAVTFVHIRSWHRSSLSVPYILLRHLNSHMCIKSFKAQQENIHGKVSENFYFGTAWC